jgi:hypothetical protein
LLGQDPSRRQDLLQLARFSELGPSALRLRSSTGILRRRQRAVVRASVHICGVRDDLLQARVDICCLKIGARHDHARAHSRVAVVGKFRICGLNAARSLIPDI